MRKALCVGQGPVWLQQTRALFQTDGIIELARRTTPALHRDLLGRLVREGQV